MSYYKIIDGVKYDKAILDIADEQIKRDGILSDNDMKLIIKALIDSKKITKIEYLTMFYVLKNYNITPNALDSFATGCTNILQLVIN